MDIMPLYNNALSKFFLKCFRRIGFFFRYVLYCFKPNIHKDKSQLKGKYN